MDGKYAPAANSKVRKQRYEITGNSLVGLVDMTHPKIAILATPVAPTRTELAGILKTVDQILQKYMTSHYEVCDKIVYHFTDLYAIPPQSVENMKEAKTIPKGGL